MIYLSIFICFYLFFFRRQRRNFLYRTHYVVMMQRGFSTLEIVGYAWGSLEAFEHAFENDSG